jgi:hypothetical protein
VKSNIQVHDTSELTDEPKPVLLAGKCGQIPMRRVKEGKSDGMLRWALTWNPDRGGDHHDCPPCQFFQIKCGDRNSLGDGGEVFLDISHGDIQGQVRSWLFLVRRVAD